MSGGRAYKDQVTLGDGPDRVSMTAANGGMTVDAAIQIIGAFGSGVTAVAADVTLDDTIYSAFIDATAAPRLGNLPLGSTISAGRAYLIQKTDASGNTVTVTPSGGDLINGAATLALTAQREATLVTWNGTEWSAIIIPVDAGTPTGKIWSPGAPPAIPNDDDLSFESLPPDSSLIGRTSDLTITADTATEHLVLSATSQGGDEDLGGRVWPIPSGSHLVTMRISMLPDEKAGFLNAGAIVTSSVGGETGIAGLFRTLLGGDFSIAGARWASPTSFSVNFLSSPSQASTDFFARFAIQTTTSKISALLSTNGVIFSEHMIDEDWSAFGAGWIPDNIGLGASNRSTGDLQLATPNIFFQTWDGLDATKFVPCGRMLNLLETS